MEAGSPLIRGRSGTHRSFTEDWMTATLVAVIASFVGALVMGMAKGPNLFGRLVDLVLVLAIASGALAALGVVVAQKLGWMRPWVAGAVCGLLGSIVAVGMYGGEGARLLGK
jgi:hypothetical protein